MNRLALNSKLRNRVWERGLNRIRLRAWGCVWDHVQDRMRDRVRARVLERVKDRAESKL